MNVLDVIIILFFSILFGTVIFFLFLDEKSKKSEQIEEEMYERPKFKPLTEEQIEEIHKKGKITPEEMVKEWERLDLCAPGDEIGSASWRCEKFYHCCHDCLIDYANQKDEYTSIHENLKLVNSKMF